MKLWVQLENYIAENFLPEFLINKAAQYLPVYAIAALMAVVMCWTAFAGRYPMERRIAVLGALLFATSATVLAFPEAARFVDTRPSTLFGFGFVAFVAAIVAGEIGKRRDAHTKEP